MLKYKTRPHVSHVSTDMEWLRTLPHCLLLLLIVFGSCAFDLMHVKQIPVKIETSQIKYLSFVLENNVDIKLDTGYERRLKKGSRWNYVGTLTYGNVYKSNDQVLTVEASNIHEAYIVVDTFRLVGFYLPVEKTLSPLASPVTLPMREIADANDKKGE